MSDHSPVKPWGCYNKPRLTGYWGSERLIVDGIATPYLRPIWIKDVMSKDCKYRHETPGDPRCAGCTCP